VFFYVPNPYVSFHGSAESESVNNDLLFWWIPAILAIAAGVAHKGAWFARLALAVVPPVLILLVLFLLGAGGAMTKESAGWGLILVMFPLRAFVIALAVTVLLVESLDRYRKIKRPSTSSTE
jgi:hypothetical protein